MVKKDWGKKHICPFCGAMFYDMKKEVVVCPKCKKNLTVEDEMGLKNSDIVNVYVDSTPPSPQFSITKDKLTNDFIFKGVLCLKSPICSNRIFSNVCKFLWII